MSGNLSNKVIVLTDKESLMPNIKSLLDRNNLSHFSRIRNLSSFNDYLKAVSETKNLNFIKTDLLDMIKKEGSPFLIIINLRNDSGTENDKDRLKTLKTILLSFLVVLQSDSYKNSSCNLFMLSDEREYEKLKAIMDKPHKILDILRTNNEKLNSAIKRLQEDSNLFNNSFNIFISNYHSTPLHIESELNTFISMIKIKERLKSRLISDSQKQDTGMTKEKEKSAEVYLRLNDRLYRNREITDEKVEGLVDGEIYIVGNFTSYTRLSVLEQLESLIKKGTGDEEVKFEKDESIIINMKEKCIPDASATVTIAQMIIKDLSDFKKIKVKTTFKNNNILKKSQGYSLLSKYLIMSE